MLDVGMDGRSDAAVGESLHGIHVRLCRLQRQLLAEVAEHDRRQAWRHAGATSEEGYLVASCAVAWRTARDWVRVAHALERHPELAGTLAAGEVSLDQLVPLVEVMAARQPGCTAPLGPFDGPGDGGSATGGSGEHGGVTPDPLAPEGTAGAGAVPGAGAAGLGGAGAGALPGSGDPDGTAGAGGGAVGAGGGGRGGDEPGPAGGDAAPESPLALAGRLSPGQLAALARRLRRRSAAQEAAAHRRRRLQVTDIDGGAGIHLEGDLFDDAAVTVRAALEEHARGVAADPETGRFAPLVQTQADGLVEWASAWLGGRERATNRPAVIVHVDARVLDGADGWAESASGPLAAETVRRLACWCQVTTVEDGPAGDPLRLGRTRRAPTWRLAEMVRRRDRRCRFPGCQRTRFVQAHHVREWVADDGPTDYENLCMLCRAHHRLVHEGGWTMSGDPCAELVFVAPSGTRLSSWPDEEPAAACPRPMGPPARTAAGSPADRPPPRVPRPPPGHPVTAGRVR